MGVYIPNMEKPKSCYNHCFEDFVANKEIGCPLNDYIESHQYKSKTHPDCPLIEIVTCGECKYWDEEEHYCNIRDSYGWDYKPTDFCSYGERRDDDNKRRSV